MATVELSLEEYEALRGMAHDNSCINCAGDTSSVTLVKPKRKPTAYNRAYSAAFKKVENRFKKLSGGWKKDGFKNAGKAARKLMK